MIIYGDSTIEGLNCEDFKIIHNNITLKEFLKEEIPDDDIIVYSLGYNDIENTDNDLDVVKYYSQLKKGKESTYIVLPNNGGMDLYAALDENLDDDYYFILTLIQYSHKSQKYKMKMLEEELNFYAEF